MIKNDKFKNNAKIISKNCGSYTIMQLFQKKKYYYYFRFKILDFRSYIYLNIRDKNRICLIDSIMEIKYMFEFWNVDMNKKNVAASI